MTIALICPDGLTAILFCRGIIAALRSAGWTRVLVVADIGAYRAAIEATGAECHDVTMARSMNLIGDLRYVFGLWKVLRTEKCYAVLSITTKPNIYGPIAARFAGSKHIVGHVVGLGSAFLPEPSLRSLVLRTLVGALYRLSCALSNHVWFTNRHDREYFINAGWISERRTTLTRNYLDTDYYAPEVESSAEIQALRQKLAIETEQLVFLMVARLIRPKGVFEFAEAARLLRDRCPQCRFLLIAPEEPPSHHTILAEELNEYEQLGNFKLLGFQENVRKFYALCDVAVLPTYYKEGGYPRGLLEPMSMGKPLVTTTSKDCRDTVDEGINGLLVPPRDAESLAQAMETLARDSRLRTSFGKNSRMKALREFDERAIVGDALWRAGLLSPK